MYTYKVRVGSPRGVGVRPPAAAHSVRIDVGQLVSHVAAEADRRQVEDADSQRLE